MQKEQVFDFSNPALYNPSYIPLMQNEAEFLHLWGSASSGKSYFEAQREIIASFRPHRRNRKTIVARKVYTTLKDSCYAQLKSVIYDWKLEDVFRMTTSPLYMENKVTGVGFLFRGFDDLEKIKSIVGADRAWYEETTESSTKQEILQLRTRLRGFKKVQVTMTYNPIDEHHYLNTEFHGMGVPGHEFHHTTYKDNIRMLEIDESFGPFIESTKETDPNYYRVYALGLWGRILGGLIYPHVTFDVDFPQVNNKDDIHQYGLDFGFSNPTSLIAQHVRDAPFKRQLINKQVLYMTGLDGPELVRVFDQIKVRKDRWIVADSARPEMIRTLRKAGYLVRPSIKFAGSVLSGINDVRSFEFCVTPGSKEIIKEVRNYQKQQLSDERWLEEPAPRQIAHSMDAIRYATQMAISPKRKVKKIKSSSQSQFE